MEEQFVLDLTPANFKQTIAMNRFVAVNYTAPRLEAERYSTEFATEYEKAASILRNNNPPIVLAQLDIERESNRELAKSQIGIWIHPSVLIFINGGNRLNDLKVYYGPHNAQGIVDYMRRIITPNPAKIKSALDATNLVGQDKEIVIIGVFPKFCGKEFKKFFAFAEEMQYRYYFGYTADAKHLPRGDTSVSGPLVRLFKPFDELFVDTKDFDALKKFAEEATRPKATSCNSDRNSPISSSSSEFVLELDSSNFTETIGKHDFIVVHFYSKCSEKFAEEYGTAAAVLSFNDPPIVLAQVHIDNEVIKELETKFDIPSFPALGIFRDGGNKVEVLVHVPHDAEWIIEQLKRLFGPFPVKIKSAVDATNLIGDGKKIVIVGVFPKLSGEEYDKFIAFAEKLRLNLEYDFGYTMDAKHLPRWESSATGPLVRLFKPSDELFADTEDFDVEALMKFVEEASTPLVTLCNGDPNNSPFIVKFSHSKNDDLAILFTKISGEGVDDFQSKYREVADKYKGCGIRFMLAGLDEFKAYRGYFGEIHVEASQVPVLVINQKIQDDCFRRKTYLKANLGPDDIAPWVDDYMAGKVREYLKSEPIPQENNGPVKVVVADTIHEMACDSKKNVLLQFYMSRSEKLDRILDDVAVHFENDAEVLIAKIDMRNNDLPEEIRNYLELWEIVDPVLYFKTAGGKIELYGGKRTKQDIIDFINKNKDMPLSEEMAH